MKSFCKTIDVNLSFFESNDHFRLQFINTDGQNDCSHLICNPDTTWFCPFSNIFLRADQDGGKRKICKVNNTFAMFCIRLTAGNKS